MIVIHSQFAHELKCLDCDCPNPASEWRASGDLVPYYCQRDPGKYSLTLVCPDCERTWYVVWDDDPGPVQRLPGPTVSGRGSTHPQAGVSTAKTRAAGAGESDRGAVSNEDILNFIESSDSTSEKSDHHDTADSPEKTIAARMVDHLKTIYTDRMLAMFNTNHDESNPLCFQSQTGELSLVVPSGQKILEAVAPHHAALNYLETEFVAPKRAIMSTLQRLIHSDRLVLQFCNTYCDYQNSVCLAQGKSAKYLFNECPAACVNFLYSFCLSEVFPNSESDLELNQRLEKHPAQVARTIDNLLSDLDYVVDPQSAREQVRLYTPIVDCMRLIRPQGTPDEVEAASTRKQRGSEKTRPSSTKARTNTAKSQHSERIRETRGKVSLRCPNCNKPLSAPKKLLGKTAKCPACQHPVKVSVDGGSSHESQQVTSDKSDTAEHLQPMRVRAEELGYDFVDLEALAIPASAIELLPESVAFEHGVIPIAFEGHRLKIATSDPTNLELEDKLRFILDYEFTWVVATGDAIRAALERHYATTSGVDVDSMLRQFTDVDETEREATGEAVIIRDASIAREDVSEVSEPVKSLVYLLIKGARAFGVTYIHLVHEDDGICVGYRIQRDCVEMLPPPRHMWPGIALHVRNMAGVDTNVESWPIVCACRRCNITYVLGVNASYEVRPNRADRVELMRGQQSWHPARPLPLLSAATPHELVEARKQRAIRKWQCDRCKYIHIYDWSRPKGLHASSFRTGQFSLRIHESQAMVKVHVRFGEKQQGERISLRLKYAKENVLFLVPPKDSSVSSPIVCTCSKCQTCYVLGVNCVAMTIREALQGIEDHRKELGSHAYDIGRLPLNEPDAVMLKSPGESWPSDRPLPPAPDDISPEILAAQRKGETRFWRCKKCENVQQYDWDVAATEDDVFRVWCPSCSSSLVADDALLGKQVNCASCGHGFVHRKLLNQ